ncbi:MAG: purine-binding chemotaxis protein CheW [Verrucomicrobia bacterium]|nr:purine-binding chemotaxis protein CheW [Verrucomicrobiota bacterium]
MTPDSTSAPVAAAKPGRYLTFRLGRESYGVPVLSVREIIRLCPITPVPRMPAYIRGVINLRGKVIPILGLREKFQLPAAPDHERACIIVVQLGTPPAPVTLMGAIVDAVEEVLLLTPSHLEATPDFGGSPDTRYLLGLATVPGGVKTLLNLDAIFLEEGTLTLPPQSHPEPSSSK